MIALALLLAATDPQAHVIERATIVAYDPEPSVDSGILMVLRPVQVTTQGGETLHLHFIHGSAGHYLGGRQGTAYPAAGATCDLIVETVRASAVVGNAADGTIRDHAIIVEARC